MAYDASILAEALELYIAGHSAARIAADLKLRHPDACRRVCEKTVLKWMTRPDAWGKTWAEKKALAHRKADERLVEKSADRLGQLNGILDDVIHRLTEGVSATEKLGQANPLWGAQILLQYLGRRAATLREAPISGAVTGEHVQLLFEVIQADGEIGPVFERRRADLLKAYEERLKAAGLEN